MDSLTEGRWAKQHVGMQDACEMLDLGRHAVMQLLKDNAIRHFRNGRAIRISVESMRQWLRSLADPGSSSIA